MGGTSARVFKIEPVRKPPAQAMLFGSPGKVTH
jgi:hypothetical protein